MSPTRSPWRRGWSPRRGRSTEACACSRRTRSATDALDRLLWLQPATGFLPHCRLASPLASETPIIVDHALEHEGPAAVLVNLSFEPPPFFSRFERLAEIVRPTKRTSQAGRERYRFYRERGYELRAHNLAER